MSDPYNTAPPRKDPWREVPVKKDRREKNPRRRARGVRGLVQRAGAKLRKRLGIESHTIRRFGGHAANPRQLTKAAQRRQAKSLLSWSEKVIKAPNVQFPGGRMSHDVARDQIALVRQKYATNPRPRPWVVEAARGKDRLYYADRNKFTPRNRAKLFTAKSDALELASVLKSAYPKALKGWTIRVAPA